MAVPIRLSLRCDGQVWIMLEVEQPLKSTDIALSYIAPSFNVSLLIHHMKCGKGTVMNNKLSWAVVSWKSQCSHHSPVQWPLLVPLACAYTGAAGIPGEP